MLIGIDPGVNGGIAYILDDTRMYCTKMPATDADIYYVLSALAEMQETHYFCVLETAQARARQKGTAKFLTHYGLLRGLLTALKIPFVTVSPTKWQTAMNCRTGGDKNVTKQLAQQLHPELKITHATADAVIICEYARKVER